MPSMSTEVSGNYGYGDGDYASAMRGPCGRDETRCWQTRRDKMVAKSRMRWQSRYARVILFRRERAKLKDKVET